MLNRDTVARTYKVCKPLVFRGIQYVPGDEFDPIRAQCVPSKLGALIRQRILGDIGPDLAEALRDVQTEAAATEAAAEVTSDGSSDTDAATNTDADAQAGTQQPETDADAETKTDAEVQADKPVEQPQSSSRRQSGRRKS